MDGATPVVILGVREAADGRAQGHRSSGPASPPDTCQSETASTTWKRRAGAPGVCACVGGSIRLVQRADAVPSVDQVSARP